MALTTSQAVLLAGILLALGLAYLSWKRASATRARAGLPKGRVIYADMAGWERCTPLYSRSLHLSGKPDYLVRLGHRVIPVEVKPSRTALEPYDADVMQLAAYCLLVEETTGHRPPWGLLRYRDQTFRIPYSRRLQRALLATLDDMRRDLRRRDVSRSHDDPQRCHFCGHSPRCEQRLVD